MATLAIRMKHDAGSPLPTSQIDFDEKQVPLVLGNGNASGVRVEDGIGEMAKSEPDVEPVETGMGPVLVHHGFLKAYESVRTQLRSVLTDLHDTYPTAKYRVTGHSLGAALATICAYDLAVNAAGADGLFQEVVTFGSPRVGNPAFVTAFTAAINTSQGILQASMVFVACLYFLLVLLVHKSVDSNHSFYAWHVHLVPQA